MGLISRVSSRTYRVKLLIQKTKIEIIKMSGGQFGGEDINALVFDFGSHSCKVGYGGTFDPTLIFPSVVGKVVETIEVVVEEDAEEKDKISDDKAKNEEEKGENEMETD